MHKIRSIFTGLFTYLLLCAFAHAWELGKAGTFQFEPIHDQVYVMHGPLAEPSPENEGFMNNPALVVLDKGLVIIDPGSSYQVGQNVLREAEKISDKPVLAVFNTHIHGDHWLGNQAIKEKYPEVKIYGHPEMIKQANGEQGLNWIDIMARMTEGKSKGTQVVAPDFAVDNSQLIEIDGQQFRIHSFVPAHTNTDIMIEHVQSKVLFLGDNGFNERIGRFDNTASIVGNIKVLEYARTLNMTTYIPGHGPSGNSDKVIEPFLAYMKRLNQVVKQGMDDDLQDFEIKQKVIAQFSDYHSWAGFEEMFGKNINSMYLELEKEAW